MKSPGAMLHSNPTLSRGSLPGTDTGQDLQHLQLISFLVPLSKTKPSGMVFRVLPLTCTQPGSPALKQMDGWRKGASVGARRRPALPQCLAAEEPGKRGRLRAHIIPSWRRQTRSPPPLRNVA